jgi:hypothetical protein
MTKPKPKPKPAEPGDEFITDATVCAEFNITKMTLWRWDQSPELDFPAPIHIAGRKYRSRRMVEEFKRRMVRKAIADRAKRRQPEPEAA